MILRNRFPHVISDERLGELVTFAADGIALGDDVIIELGTTSGVDGEAAGLFRSPPYGWHTNSHPDARYLVRAAFRSEAELLDGTHWPCSSSPAPVGRGSAHLAYLDAYAPLPRATVQTLEEEIVYIFGHECFHLDQHRRDEAAGWTLYTHADGTHDADRIEHEAEANGQARLAAFRR